MKNIVVLLLVAVIFCGCPVDRTIESVIIYTTEKNSSSYDLFIQYYLDNGSITRKKILKNTENRIHYLSGGTAYAEAMLKNNYLRQPDADPQLDYYDPIISNPNEKIIKILIIDINSNKLIKRLEKIDNMYILNNAEDNYDMRARFEYWFFEITDEWLAESN